jgi:N-acetylmuramic acid 6-phosphate etherase
MVDLAPSNAKLRDRAGRIVSEIAGVPRDEAERLLAAGGSVKVAIVMARLALEPAAARARLDAAGGSLRRALGESP